MILSDREIKAAMARGAIRITPEPAATAWSSTAVDLTLDANLSFWQSPSTQGVEAAFCPHSKDYDFAALSEKYSKSALIGAIGHILPPREFVLGWSLERIKLPHQFRLAARVEGKSSLARLGLGVHVTAPTIHSGFGTAESPDYPGSPIRLEIWNVGPLHIRLQKGMPICQLIFEWVDGTPEKGYGGQFNLQGPPP